MLYREHLRFKGYWLGLLAWLVLSFAAPVASAISDPEAGWLRLCSAQGATWIQAEGQAPNGADLECNCLFTALPPTSAVALLSVSGGETATVELPELLFLSDAYTRYQPRSPPVF